jgi:hypothetical protein
MFPELDQKDEHAVGSVLQAILGVRPSVVSRAVELIWPDVRRRCEAVSEHVVVTEGSPVRRAANRRLAIGAPFAGIGDAPMRAVVTFC